MSRCMRRGRLGYITLVVGGEVSRGEVAVEVVMGEVGRGRRVHKRWDHAGRRL